MKDAEGLLISLVVQASRTERPVTTPWPFQDDVVAAALDIDSYGALGGDVAASRKLEAADSPKDRTFPSGLLQKLSVRRLKGVHVCTWTSCLN